MSSVYVYEWTDRGEVPKGDVVHHVGSVVIVPVTYGDPHLRYDWSGTEEQRKRAYEVCLDSHRFPSKEVFESRIRATGLTLELR